MRLLITGAGGFIGSRVVRAARTDQSLRIRLMSHCTPVGPGADQVVVADLTRPDTLRGVCDGVDAVIHCASLIGGAEDECRSVNALGTRALVAEAGRAEVRRMVYLSTAAVCGPGPFRRAGPSSVAVAPGSVTSRSRASAESYVLAAGGTVVRPDLVYGRGDRHAVPGLVRLHRAVAARVDGWGSLLSFVDADDLARVLLAAAVAPTDVSGVRHVNHPDPVPCSQIMEVLATAFGLPPHREDMDLATARARIAGDARAVHHLDFVAYDRWFAGAEVWEELGCRPGEPFAAGFSRHIPWYRKALDASGAL